MTGRPEARHLLIFAKAPILGRVKRRLAAEIGAVPAWTFYRRNTGAVIRRLARDPRWTTTLVVAPDAAARSGRWWPRGLTRTSQGRGDLGRRMDRALRAPPPGPVVLVGSDVPDIRPADIEAAFRLLGRKDLVFGPAADGGFWLIGARRRPRFPYLFRNIRWSTPDALRDTLANLPADLTAGFVRVLEDVDDGAAWARYRRALKFHATGPAPASAA